MTELVEAVAPVRAPSRSWARASLPLLLVCVAGAGLSLQSFVNGRLGANLGSPQLAGSISYTVGVLAVSLLLLTTGKGSRAIDHMRGRPRPRWWHLAACVASAIVVIVPAKAAPELGVALLTVALVCGQASGSLVMDAIGLGTGGRRPLTAPRVLGVVIALVAVTVGALGREGALDVGLLALAVFAGVIIALVQAALGHITEYTGDPVSATAFMFVIGLPASVASWLIIDGLQAPGGWSAPLEQWVVGGLLGIAVTVVVARVVGALGVLVSTLALVAGQTAGGLILDAVAPAAGQSVTARTVLSVVLTFVAVAVSGMAGRRSSRVA
jgi:transporter family-2 protein